MDRNLTWTPSWEDWKKVALLAEGVDRNRRGPLAVEVQLMSPSSRRAWIEIVDWQTQTLDYNVALLAEGVDRNHWRQELK